METLSIEKEEFIKIISLLKNNNNFRFLTKSQQLKIPNLDDLYPKTINILTSIILKYHNKDDWFFKEFFNLFLMKIKISIIYLIQMIGFISIILEIYIK